MSRRRAPWRALSSRCSAFLWGARGRLALAQGRLSPALAAFERAASCRPGAFGPLMRLARSYLLARDTWRAHRTLAQAREADPKRFARCVPVWLAREGLEAEAIRHVLAGAVIRTGWGPKAPVQAIRRRPLVRHVEPASLPYGDCRDLDEYARFRALPPITEAERETIDWDVVLEDLLEGE